MMKSLKLLKINKSDKSDKKYMAIFLVNKEKTKTIHFGSAGMRDFTKINDKNSKWYLPKALDRNVVKDSYLRRHEKNEDWNNPLTAGSLSRWILWDKKTLDSSIKAFVKKFKL